MKPKRNFLCWAKMYWQLIFKRYQYGPICNPECQISTDLCVMIVELLLMVSLNLTKLLLKSNSWTYFNFQLFYLFLVWLKNILINLELCFYLQQIFSLLNRKLLHSQVCRDWKKYWNIIIQTHILNKHEIKSPTVFDYL